jgi:histidinol phosphatase-like PHP family hydrolase
MRDTVDPATLDSGLWHVHTAVTDGAHDAATLLAAAQRAKFPAIGFVEHVRQEPTYDFGAFADRVEALAVDYTPQCVVGCEATVRDTDGRLDATGEILDRAAVVYAAYHGRSFPREEYVESVLAMLENPAVDVWAHPFDYAARQGFEITDAERDRILDRLRAEEVYFELNLRRPTRMVSRALLGTVPTIPGYDLHNLSNWQGLGADH